MPNRIIKDSIARSEKINNLSDFQFRLWVHLLTYVDDYGRGDARPAIIKGTCFPFRDRMTNKDIEKGLAELAGAGCVGLYTVDGKPYLYFPNWEEHQRVRTKVSKCPVPSENDNVPQIAADCGELPQIAARIQNPESESRIQNPDGDKADKPPTRPRFITPTVDDVREYCAEQGYIAVDPQRFVDYYTSNGWKVGKSPMKDWKAAVRGWESRDKQKEQRYPSKKPAIYGSGALGDAEMEAILRVLREG